MKIAHTRKSMKKISKRNCKKFLGETKQRIFPIFVRKIVAE